MENDNKQLVCGIYTRVSSQGQVEEGYSLDEQKRLLKEHAKKQGYIVYDIYTDPGISARDIAHRPQIQRLIADIEEGRINVVCAFKLNRTFRCLNELTTVMEVMRKNNVIFDFKAEGILDLNTTTGKLQAQILGMVAEMERDNIAEAVYMGMAAAARAGKYQGGTPPYGYSIAYDTVSNNKRKSRKLVICEAESIVVKRIFQMFVEENAGYKHICNTLNKESSDEKPLRTRNGKEFSVCGIRDILSNPIYMGYVRWGAHRNWSDKRRKGTTEPIVAKGEHEPIISEEMFKQAETIRLGRGGKCQRKYDCMNVLTGILKCPECGAGMVLSRGGGKGKKKISYYSCGKWKNKGGSCCRGNSVNLEQVNSVVLDKISELCNDELIVRGVLKKINYTRSNKIDGTELDRVDAQKQLDKIKRDILYLQQRFEADDCDMDVSVYKRRIRELRSQEEVFTMRLSQLQVDIRSHQAEKIYTIEELREVFKGIKSILERSDVTEVRTLLHLMIEKITINPETRNPKDVTIKFNNALINYVGSNFEEEANNASSFCYAHKKELVFTLSL